MLAVQMVVMDHRVDVLAQQILCGPSQHLLGCTVHERGLAVRVHAIDTFARCVQDQLVLALQIREKALRPLPFDQAAVVQP